MHPWLTGALPVVSQAVADRSAGALRREQLGNISAKAQKDIADVSAFTFQVATSAFLANCSDGPPSARTRGIFKPCIVGTFSVAIDPTGCFCGQTLLAVR